MAKYRFFSLIILIFGALVGFFAAANWIRPTAFYSLSYKLGLDLQGGVHLVYEADTKTVPFGQVSEAMAGLRDVIERRVNLFGVGEPIVQVEHSGSLSGGNISDRLIVDLPGVTDISKAIATIGETPILEFRKEEMIAAVSKVSVPENQTKDELAGAAAGDASSVPAPSAAPENKVQFVPTGLDGRFLKKATLDFDQTTYKPIVSLEFNDKGAKLFGQITKENVGKQIAIYLDGAVISAPTVREKITSGKAQITGQFTPDEAKILVRHLNSGALPLPVKLISRESVGATLGARVLTQGVYAGIIGFLFVALFLIIWYRLPGLVAVLALCIYTFIMLSLFKLIPVTLTAAGIAGFILSVGMAVDANILIFERMKEERALGKDLVASVTEGFERAWLSIRDSNMSSLITSIILFWMGTSVVKGFALTLGVGVLVSMFSAITLSRTFLLALKLGNGRINRFLFGSGA